MTLNTITTKLSSAWAFARQAPGQIQEKSALYYDRYVPQSCRFITDPIKDAILSHETITIITSVASSTFWLMFAHKSAQGMANLLSFSGLNIVSSLQTGGMIGVAVLVDYIFGLAVNWGYRKLVGTKTTQVPQWEKDTPINGEKSENLAKKKVEIPHWLRISQRVAALAVTYLAFSAIFGPQPILLACFVMEITTMIFFGILAGLNNPCSETGIKSLCGQHISAPSFMLLAGFGAVVVIGYLVSLVAQDRFYKDAYYIVEDGKVTQRRKALLLENAKNEPIGLCRVNNRDKLIFDGKEIDPKNLPSLLGKLQEQRSICQNNEPTIGQLKSIHPSLTPRRLTDEARKALEQRLSPTEIIEALDQELRPTAEKWAILTKIRIDTITKEQLEKQKRCLSKKLKELQDQRKTLLDQLYKARNRDKSIICMAQQDELKASLKVETELKITEALLLSIDKKGLEETISIYHNKIATARKNLAVFNKIWAPSARAFLSSLQVDTGLVMRVIKDFLVTKERILDEQNANLKQHKKAEERTFYKVLYKGQEAIMDIKDIRYFIDANKFSQEELKGGLAAAEQRRQENSTKAGTIQNAVGAFAHSFLSQSAGSFLGGGGVKMQAVLAAGAALTQLGALLPEKLAAVKTTIFPLIAWATSTEIPEDDPNPTGNGDEAKSAVDAARFRAQVAHLAQVLPYYEKIQNNHPALAAAPGHPVFRTSNLIDSALVDELGISLNPQEVKNIRSNAGGTRGIKEEMIKNKEIELFKSQNYLDKAKEFQRRLNSIKMDLITPLPQNAPIKDAKKDEELLQIDNDKRLKKRTHPVTEKELEDYRNIDCHGMELLPRIPYTFKYGPFKGQTKT